MSIVRILQLLRVRLGDGVDTVGRDDRSLHEVRAVVKAQNLVAAAVKSQHIVVEMQVGLTLIFNIVNGKNTLRLAEIPGELRFHEQRHKCRLPVMAMHHVWLQAKTGHK